MLDEVGALAVHALHDSRNHDPVAAILDAYFEPRWERRGGHPHASLRVNEWEIKEFARKVIPQLVEVDGLLLLRVLTQRLDALLDEKVPEVGEVVGVKDDYSTIWVSDLTSEEHLYGADPLLAHLATRTLDGIVASESANPDEVIAMLGGGAWAIHRRLHLHFLSRCAHSETVREEIVDRLTDAPLAGSYQMRREYDGLLRSAFAGVAPEDQEAILSTLATAAEEKGDRASVWLYERLAVISGHLTGEWLRRFTEYAEEFGEPRGLPPSLSFTWDASPERSPLGADEVEGMTATALSRFAREWAPPKDGHPFDRPTWRGLARQVEGRAKRRPAEFSAAAASFADGNRTVVASVLGGLRDAVKEGAAIDWESTLVLITALAAKDEARDRDEHLDFDEDASWSRSKREALELLRAGFDASAGPSLELRSELWAAIDLMAVHGAVREDVTLDGDARDSVFLAMNATRSQAVYAAIDYLRWLAGEGVQGAPDEVEALLRRVLRPEHEPFIGMRAAIAPNLPVLAYVDEDWVVDLLPAIFPDRAAFPEHWDAAWDAYVKYTRRLPPEAVLRALEDDYATAIRLIDQELDVSPNRDPRVHLGMHLMIMFLTGICPLDQPNLVAFFDRAPAPVRVRIVEWVGQSTSEDNLSEDWFARAREFFEWREQRVREDGLDGAELCKLGWYVAAGTFPVEWWGPRLPGALGASTDSFLKSYVPLDDMMAQVAAVSSEHPAMALDVLAIVLSRNEGEWHEPYLASADTILTRASEQSDLLQRVYSLADRLARAGYEQFERFSGSA